MASSEQWFELSTVIRVLRAQLNTALAEGEKDKIQFQLGPVDLDFEVAVRSASEAEGGLKIHVLSLGAKGSKSRESTNRMKLVLKPVTPEGKTAQVGDTANSIPDK